MSTKRGRNTSGRSREPRGGAIESCRCGAGPVPQSRRADTCPRNLSRSLTPHCGAERPCRQAMAASRHRRGRLVSHRLGSVDGVHVATPKGSRFVDADQIGRILTTCVCTCLSWDEAANQARQEPKTERSTARVPSRMRRRAGTTAGPSDHQLRYGSGARIRTASTSEPPPGSHGSKDSRHIAASRHAATIRAVSTPIVSRFRATAHMQTGESCRASWRSLSNLYEPRPQSCGRRHLDPDRTDPHRVIAREVGRDLAHSR